MVAMAGHSGKALVAVLSLVMASGFQPAEAKSSVSVLYSFVGGSNGHFPNTGLITDSAGNLIGGAGGGDYNGGVIFRVSQSGEETVLHSFGNTGDGNSPEGGLISDAQGNLYGTTYLGGPGGFGTVFKLAPGGGYTVLYSFKGGADGGYPSGTLTRDDNGNLYGTAGAGPRGVGIVFKVSPAGAKSTVYAFAGGDDGAYPASAHLVLDKKGNLYGTTSQGGANGKGTIFKVTPAGKESVLHSFDRADGEAPNAGLIVGKGGIFYGTTSGGGTNLAGTVFKFALPGQLTVLYSFAGGSDGANPLANVILDKSGNLYGTTSSGGDSDNDGTVFELNADGSKVLGLPLKRARDGSSPTGSLVMDRRGDLYGTAYYGGAEGASDGGTVFKVKN